MPIGMQYVPATMDLSALRADFGKAGKTKSILLKGVAGKLTPSLRGKVDSNQKSHMP